MPSKPAESIEHFEVSFDDSVSKTRRTQLVYDAEGAKALAAGFSEDGFDNVEVHKVNTSRTPVVIKKPVTDHEDDGE